MRIALAFYKSEGNWVDLLVRLWTRSPYSHCELIIDGMGYSSSPRDGGVRAKKINFDSGNWDIFEIKSELYFKADLLDFVRVHQGKGYDWLGIFFGQVFGIFFLEDKSRWFCSEFCAAVLKVPKPWRFSPESLHRYCFEEHASYFHKFL